jgi:hypothetical protein
VEGHARFAHHGGDVGSGSGGDDDLRGPETVTPVDDQLSRALELGRALEERHVVGILAVGAPTGGDRIDAAEDPVADVGPADAVDAAVDPVPGRVPDRLGHLGRVDVHLGRDAPDVEAGAAEGPRSDQRHPFVGKVLGDQRVAGARPDDGEVKIFHRSRLRHPMAVPGRPGNRGRYSRRCAVRVTGA